MRFVATILVIVQLLVRGMAVPHSHAHDGRPEPADHVNRPHVHLLGHSHSHTAGHQNSKHRHPHQHGVPHRNSDPPVVPNPTDPAPLSSGHDQDAVYVGEILAAPTDRFQAPEPTDAVWFHSDFELGKQAIPLRLIECRVAGPPGEGIGTPVDLLPHLLRV